VTARRLNRRTVAFASVFPSNRHVRSLRALFTLLSLAAAGCSGLIGEPVVPSVAGSDASSPAGSKDAGAQVASDAGFVLVDGAMVAADAEPPVGSDGSVATAPPCDESRFDNLTIDDVAARFVSRVYPSMLEPSTGCISCHGSTSGRDLIVDSDGTETFHRANARGLLGDTPGGVLARLTSLDPSTRMPRGLPPWGTDLVNEVADVVCAIRAVQRNAPLPDEIFPPELDQPYSGPAVDEFDDTFLSYPQLRGRIRSVFQDEWVRGSEDRFAENIGSFGGVDFTTRLVEGRGPSSDYLLAMDQLARDVCGVAASSRTGPFSGLTLTTPLTDIPASTVRRLEAENSSQMTATVGAVAGTQYSLYSNGSLTTTNPFNFPAAGQYAFRVRARGTLADNVGPDMDVRVDGRNVRTFTNIGTTLQTYSVTATVAAGAQLVSLAFTNDRVSNGDRNLYIDWLEIEGPIGAGTGNTRVTAARNNIDQLYRRILVRKATTADKDEGYQLLIDLTGIDPSLVNAWAGLCEGLVKHPDFLFTRAPSRATADAVDRQQLLLVKVALDLVARPPSNAELSAFTGGMRTLDQLIDDYLASAEFRDYFFYKMRIRTESRGTENADEPARLWVHLLASGAPLGDLLIGEYAVGTDLQPLTRPPEHGKTGVLTMKGYIETKPGLPHFNYSARVLSDFLGYVFEVPPEVIEQRRLSTAASTVDPTSICYSCHKLLTPLAYQRLAWADDGTYRTMTEDGQLVDDTDHDLVAEYPFKGKGMESFATQAVKKERFIRTTLNAIFQLLIGRPMRHDQDERVMYRELWDEVARNRGDLRAIIKAIIASPGYQED
jgi:hypothetical protein